jgi:hypothetical protein
MGLLEKLRPQPRWRHADPSVRIAAVYDLGPDDADTLTGLARDDGDARVRRAAVGRLTDVEVLEDIGRTDPDEDVRGEAVRALAGLGAEAADAEKASTVARALIALGRFKEAVAAARDNPSPAARAAVVDLLDDKSLGALSRHAKDGDTRLRALARMTDPAEVLSVALKCDHTDAAVAALERIDEAEALGLIAHRARNKVASRRARTKLRQVEETARPAADAPVVEVSSADLARAHELLHHVEGLVATTDPDEASAALAALRLSWAELQADVELGADLLRQFDAAGEAVREAIDARRREAAAELERAQALAAEQAGRLAIVAEIEQLQGVGAADRIAELRVQWDGLPAMPVEYAASLTRRFQDASRAFEDRERRRRLAEAAASRLESLATELEHLARSQQAPAEVVARWRGLRRDVDVLREHAFANRAAAERLEAAVAALEQKEADSEATRVKRAQEALRRLQQLCLHGEKLAESDTLTLKAGERALRDLRAALEDRTPLPSRQDRSDIQARLLAARARLAPRVQELREADEWQRWANLHVQEEICLAMEALRSEADLDVASRQMRALQNRWKEVALAPRTQGEAMWRRFKAAQDEVYARTAAFMAAQHEQRVANLSRKRALCEKAEALADSTAWVKTATEIQALQAEWKTIGPVARGHERAVWERFRTACDHFFTRRQADLKQRKDEWAANLARKETLCESAEALADSSDWEAAATALRQLQAEWKTVGPVRKSKSEAIWRRFRGACDRFFERYKHRDQIELQEKAAVRERVILQLEALVSTAPAGGERPLDRPADVYDVIQQARAEWQQAPELPRAIQQELAARYHQAVGRVVAAWPDAFAGTDLDPETTRKRMERLLAKVEDLASKRANGHGNLSPTELLALQLRERLAANTMSGGAGAVEAEVTRRRQEEQEVRSAQAQWTRLGPVPPQVAGPLNERFQRACRRFFDARQRAS